MNEISIALKNEIEEIERLSEIVSEFGNEHHLSEEFVYAVNLALDEILTNTISYGYADKNTHEITVTLRVQGNELAAEIIDDARAFDPLSAPKADVNLPLEQREVGGLGIHLARTLMDEMAYRREGNKNVLIMKKRIAS
jgi:anti-sigma regulatory factor (Ser/Thr protein kinase)